jgi:tetratricopeptide (TPR) repeat protein
MEIHIQRGGQQHGPYPIEQIKAWLLSGDLPATVMSSHDRGTSWFPLFCLPAIRDDESLGPVLRTATSGNPAVEAKVLQATAGEIDQLLANTDATARVQIQGRLQWKLRIYWKQVFSFKTQFPNLIEASAFEASYYSALARTKLSSVGSMRKSSATTSNLAWGIVSGMLANKEEKNNALQAMSLFDQAISVFDNAGDRLTKAYIYKELKQPENALKELNHIVANFPEDPLYFDARQLKDEIETP